MEKQIVDELGESFITEDGVVWSFRPNLDSGVLESVDNAQGFSYHAPHGLIAVYQHPDQDGFSIALVDGPITSGQSPLDEDYSVQLVHGVEPRYVRFVVEDFAARKLLRGGTNTETDSRAHHYAVRLVRREVGYRASQLVDDVWQTAPDSALLQQLIGLLLNKNGVREYARRGRGVPTAVLDELDKDEEDAAKAGEVLRNETRKLPS